MLAMMKPRHQVGSSAETYKYSKILHVMQGTDVITFEYLHHFTPGNIEKKKLRQD